MKEDSMLHFRVSFLVQGCYGNNIKCFHVQPYQVRTKLKFRIMDIISNNEFMDLKTTFPGTENSVLNYSISLLSYGWIKTKGGLVEIIQ
jgi:hypothetical protein